jgi:hypothetical protein
VKPSVWRRLVSQHASIRRTLIRSTVFVKGIVSVTIVDVLCVRNSVSIHVMKWSLMLGDVFVIEMRWITLTHSHTHTQFSSHPLCRLYVTMHIIILIIIKPTRRTDFSNLFLEWNSTCFGQFLCPSSGVFHYTHTAVVYVIQFCR